MKCHERHIDTRMGRSRDTTAIVYLPKWLDSKSHASKFICVGECYVALVCDSVRISRYITQCLVFCSQVPYNMERLMLLFSDYNTDLVKAMMTEFETNGRVQIDEDVLKAMQSVIVGEQMNGAGNPDFY